MRIKKLELSGFKSFKDRTVIHFDAGITGVVGPNGCGKSNIIDALLWVMGEQSAKHLRGSSMEDVIFGGAENYAPAGLAEVSITLENDGGPFPAKYMNFSEIQATRRLHRSGESEYLINRESSRLRDIQEIFMDTGAGSKGFSIVEQGAIGKIITAKPEDRRTLIEEAAGITKFKVRKRESQKKLESTEQNLLRLYDIVAELKRQLDSLEKQARRAERYREIKTKIEDLDLWLSSRKFVELRDLRESSQKTFDEVQANGFEARVEFEKLESDYQISQLQVLEKERDLNDRQQTFLNLKDQIQEKESRLQGYRFEVESARRNAQMQGTLRQESELRKQVLEREKSEVDSKLLEVRRLAEDYRQEFELIDLEYKEVEEEIRDLDQRLTITRRELVAVTQAESHVRAQLEVVDGRVTEFAEKAQNSLYVLEELKLKRTEFEERKTRLSLELDQERQRQLEVVSSIEGFETLRGQALGDLSLRETELQVAKDELNKVISRLYGLENLRENFEGFEEGVKAVLMWQKKSGLSESEFVPLAEVVEVDPQFELAMESVLGPRLQTLMGGVPEDCTSAISHLKEINGGRSSFIIETTNRVDYGVPPKGPGVIGVLSELVRAPDVFKKNVQALLSGVVVVDQLTTARQLHPEYTGWTFVTLDGDSLSCGGVLTGGSTNSVQTGLVQRRREIRQLISEKEEGGRQLQTAQTQVEETKQRYESLQKDLENALRRKSEQEIVLTEKRKDLERAESEFSNLIQALNRQQTEVNNFEMQRSSHEIKRSELAQSLGSLVEKKDEGERNSESLDVELLQARQGVDDLRRRATQAQVKAASKKQELEGLSSQLEMLERNYLEVTSQLERMDEETSKNSQSLSQNQIFLEEGRVEFDQLVTKVQGLGAEIANLRNEYEVLSASSRSMDGRLSELRRHQNELQVVMNESQLKIEEARLKEQYLTEQILERYQVQISEMVPKYQGRVDDVSAGQAELDELKEKVKKIGDVNLSAIQEFDELVTRHKFLSQQQEDLVSAKDQLRKVIDRINRICSKRFRDTFAAVNERFEKVFPVLFGGGEAKLILVEDPEKDEVGIDIVARPPGKKPQSITLLSGGEKALTAVSLIFSIFLVKPSPFCLLDEVDAPLDDANVYRFNDLVREMAKRSQIIVITHNKHTMEINERLYGVTMEERGVSKMVSVDLRQAREVAVM